jgi:hypothetical protein
MGRDVDLQTPRIASMILNGRAGPQPFAVNHTSETARSLYLRDG